MAFDLSTLLKEVPTLGTDREQIEYIRLEMLEEDPNNFYQLSEIPELAANIQLCGLQQPIRVRQGESGKYRIVSGHRRRAAVELLAQEDPEKWAEVACIVEQDAASDALQELRLIFANSSTRKMTDAERAKEAAKVKELLYHLKEVEGYEFPGRMRDHVAEVVGISKSKLSRLEAIEKNLAEVWQPLWNDGTLSESTAGEIAKMEKWLQNLLYEERSKKNFNFKYFYGQDAAKFTERAAGILKQKCRRFGGECVNCEGKLRKAAVSERYGWFSCDGKCCKDCTELLKCKRACPRLADLIREDKATAKQAELDAKARQAERDRPGAEFARLVYERIGAARKANHVSVQRLVEAQKKFYSASVDDEKQKNMERGRGEYSPCTNLPFGWNLQAQTLLRVREVADALGCSIDYLFGRTDQMEVAAGNCVPGSGTIWHPISEEPPTGVDLVWLDASGYSDTGTYWGGGDIESVCTIRYAEARWWAELPKED